MKKKSGAGGYRTGSGRPQGTGKYGEKTCPVRVPISLLPKIKALLLQNNSLNSPVLSHYRATSPLATIKPATLAETSGQTIPLYATRVAAGTPSPADEYIDQHLDVAQFLIKRPTSTFLVRAEGDSMINAGIQENDLLIVDRSLEPKSGKIIIAAVNGHLTVKRLQISNHKVHLMPENPRYMPIEINEDTDFRIWGVVIHVIHSLST